MGGCGVELSGRMFGGDGVRMLGGVEVEREKIQRCLIDVNA
jgi:hypothetical protein